MKNKKINKNKKDPQRPKVYIHSAAVNWHAIGNVERSTVLDLNPSSLVQVEEYIIPSSGCLKWSFPHFDFFFSSGYFKALAGRWRCAGVGNWGAGLGLLKWSGRKRRRGRLGMTPSRRGPATATDPGSVERARRAVWIAGGAVCSTDPRSGNRLLPFFFFFFFAWGGTNWREEFRSQRGQF